MRILSCLVTILVVIDHLDGPLNTELILRQRRLHQQQRLRQGQLRSSLLKPQLHPHQEEMRQDHQRQMMMPTPPSANLVVGKTGFALGEAGIIIKPYRSLPPGSW